MPIKSDKREMIMVVNDFHIPYHDTNAVRLAIDFAKEYRPSILIMHELLDFYSLSRYSKNPKRIGDLPIEVDKSLEIQNRFRKAVGNSCEIIMLSSNHDERLQSYLWNVAPALSSLKGLAIENLLKLDSTKIKYMKDYTYRNVLFKHGDLVRKDAGASAKAEFLKEGMSGASGHTHRLGSYFVTLRGGSYLWIECGCLCLTKDIEYIEGTPNWQNGFGFYSFKKNSHHFSSGVVPIINNQIYFDDKVFY